MRSLSARPTPYDRADRWGGGGGGGGRFGGRGGRRGQYGGVESGRCAVTLQLQSSSRQKCPVIVEHFRLDNQDSLKTQDVSLTLSDVNRCGNGLMLSLSW